MNERRLIQVALIPRALHWMVDLLERHPDSDPAVFRPIRQAFAADVNGILERERDPQRRERLRERLDKAVTRLMAPYKGRVMTTPFLALKYLTDELMAEGLWASGEVFDRAWDDLSYALLDHDPKKGAENAAALDAADGSARKNARRMRSALSDMGLFRPVAVEAAA